MTKPLADAVKHLSNTSGRVKKGGDKLSERDLELLEEGAMEINPEELREFLEADLLGVRADPDFKERLRRRLWALVRARYTSRSRDRERE